MFKVGDLVICVEPISTYDDRFNLKEGKFYIVTNDNFMIKGHTLNYSKSRFRKVRWDEITKLERLIYGVTNE
jgi:hypothetical protein